MRKRKAANVPVRPDAALSVPVAGIAYTESECAFFLRLKNRSTLTKWRCTGSQPGLKHKPVGDRIVYMGEDILRFLGSDLAPAKRGKP